MAELGGRRGERRPRKANSRRAATGDAKGATEGCHRGVPKKGFCSPRPNGVSDMTAFQAQAAQCGPSPVHEINLRDVLDADFERHRGIAGQIRATLSRLGVESSCSIIVNGPKHSIGAPASRYFEP